jgi:hypothetical protein
MAVSKGGGRKVAAAGGIGAKGGKRLPTSSGRTGKLAPAGSAAKPIKSGFGLKTGSSKPMTRRGTSPAPASSAGTTAKGAFGLKGKTSSGGSSSGNSQGHGLKAPYEPGHTFAASTIQRTSQMKKMPTGPVEPDTDDNTKSPPKSKASSTKMAAGMGFKAAASSAANSAGVSPQAGAAMVAAATQGASAKAKKKNPNLKKVPTKGSTQQKGGTYS